MLTQTEVLKRISGLKRTDLELWVRHRWVIPACQSDAYAYREIDVARVRLIYELRTELSIDEEAIPALLSLVDQVYGLRRELRSLAQAVQQEEDDVRRRIAAHVTLLRRAKDPSKSK